MDFDRVLFANLLKSGMKGWNRPLTARQLAKMERFASGIISVNEQLNLTRLTSTEEMAIKNFMDSLSLLLLEWPQKLSCIDIGTGSGFPGLVLAIARPGWSLSLLDSLRKRLVFLEDVCRDLELTNVVTMHCRAEDVGRDRDLREKYDLVCSRAVADLPVLIELCGALVKVGGRFVAFKAREAEAELDRSGKALSIMGLETEQMFPVNLPMSMGERKLLVFRKIMSSDEKYPRRAGIPARSPLLEE